MPHHTAGTVVQQLQAASAAAPDAGAHSRQLSALLASAPGGGGGCYSIGAAGAGSGVSGGPLVPDELAYSKKPRAVNFTPYGLRDYEDRYDVKKAAGYWQLGRLGPENESKELLAKVRACPRARARTASGSRQKKSNEMQGAPRLQLANEPCLLAEEAN
jgi:hypothetical protein